MSKNYTNIAVKPETKDKLISECMEEYRKHHPELDHIPISHDKILHEVCKYYLEK